MPSNMISSQSCFPRSQEPWRHAPEAESERSGGRALLPARGTVWAYAGNQPLRWQSKVPWFFSWPKHQPFAEVAGNSTRCGALVYGRTPAATIGSWTLDSGGPDMPCERAGVHKPQCTRITSSCALRVKRTQLSTSAVLVLPAINSVGVRACVRTRAHVCVRACVCVCARARACMRATK